MPVIRRKLEASSVYPDDIRYDPDTDQVQRRVNNDWVDAPESDPRTHTTLPPRITDNSACDAAQTIRDDLKGQIDGIMEAIDNAGTAFTIAGIILSIFSFGLFAIFISIALGIADAMLSAGTGALTAALTEPVYDQFQCILYCQFKTNGRLKPGGLAIAMSDINEQIGGLAATILNSMLALAGEGGINNLAAQGTVTGDCSSCDACGPPCGDLWAVNVGTFLGVFDGYYRYQSSVTGTTQVVEIATADNATCCKMLDFRYVENGDSVVANYRQECGADITQSGWPLEGCYHFLAGQVVTGDSGTVWVVEFLFADC